jgi:dienelactone hydrolase
MLSSSFTLFSSLLVLLGVQACAPSTAGFDGYTDASSPADTWEKVDVQAALRRYRGRVLSEPTPFPGSALYVQQGGRPGPGLVLLHGSEGGDAGFSDLMAMDLASRGFSVLAFSYYHSPGTPYVLANIPIERTEEAARWLKDSSWVHGNKVGLYGVSRGAEQAVLLASLLSDSSVISAVGVHAPYHAVVESFDPETYDSVPGPYGRPLPAWTYRGTVPPPGAAIELEKFAGPVFLSHGTRDEVWGVEETRELERRLVAAGKAPEVHYWPGEGHILDSARPAFMNALSGFFSRELSSGARQ